MIELAMVKRMVRRGLLAAPLVVIVLGLTSGPKGALSGAVGLALTLANLWLAGRLIGGMAENRPELLAAAAFGAFALGLGALTIAAILLNRTDAVEFTIVGLTLIASHLVLVTWEAADNFLKIPKGPSGNKRRPSYSPAGPRPEKNEVPMSESKEHKELMHGT